MLDAFTLLFTLLFLLIRRNTAVLPLVIVDDTVPLAPPVASSIITLAIDVTLIDDAPVFFITRIATPAYIVEVMSTLLLLDISFIKLPALIVPKPFVD